MLALYFENLQWNKNIVELIDLHFKYVQGNQNIAELMALYLKYRKWNGEVFLFNIIPNIENGFLSHKLGEILYINIVNIGHDITKIGQDISKIRQNVANSKI